MNTTSQYRRAAVLAAVALAFALPLAACQTPPPRNTMQVTDVRSTPTPAPSVGPPAEAPASPTSRLSRSQAYTLCAERLVAEGAASLEFAKAYCTGESVLLPY